MRTFEWILFVVFFVCENSFSFRHTNICCCFAGLLIFTKIYIQFVFVDWPQLHLFFSLFCFGSFYSHCSHAYVKLFDRLLNESRLNIHEKEYKQANKWDRKRKRIYWWVSLFISNHIQKLWQQVAVKIAIVGSPLKC